MAASIIAGDRLVGARSLTCRVDFDAPAAVILNTDLLGLTTSGTAIFNFLNTAYASAAAAEAAFAAAGGEVLCRAQAGTLQPTAIGWTVNIVGPATTAKPDLTAVGGDANTVATLLVRLAHSVIQ